MDSQKPDAQVFGKPEYGCVRCAAAHYQSYEHPAVTVRSLQGATPALAQVEVNGYSRNQQSDTAEQPSIGVIQSIAERHRPAPLATPTKTSTTGEMQQLIATSPENSRSAHHSLRRSGSR